MLTALPSMTELVDSGAVPRVHPNGFIQLDLDEAHRLHVWHPGLPYRQRTYHSIHDHVFGFKSRVYSGQLVNVVYLLDRHSPTGRAYSVWHAVQTGPEESVLKQVPNKYTVTLIVDHLQVVSIGQTYIVDRSVLHENLFNEPTLTVIEKFDSTIYQDDLAAPRVLVPCGVQPDNDFRRDDVDVTVLWDLVHEAHPGTKKRGRRS